MEEFNSTQMPTNICRSRVIFKGSRKQLERLVGVYDNENSIFTYICKLIKNDNKEFLEDMIKITKDTEIEYIEFTVNEKEVEMSLLDSGYCNINIIKLIATYMGIDYIILSYNQDTDFFVNTDKSYKTFKHKLALLNFNKEVVAFGSSIKEAFNTIDIVIPDEITMMEFMELLSSYNLVVSEFDDKFPPYILNDNVDILNKYQRQFK